MIVSIPVLKLSVSAALAAAGVPVEHAAIVADCFVTADEFGVSTHGVAILGAHLERIRHGGYNLRPEFSVLRRGVAFSVIDADNAMGPVSAVHCMRMAMSRATEAGVYSVFSRHANTYGPAFYYPLLAARQGLIGITFSNSPAAMPPVGGRDKLLGTNPFAVVVPGGEENPVILDMATSVVAKSRINEFRKRGEKIPEGWALDSDGKPTTDPEEAIKGLVLPMAGFKGYGMAMMLDVLSGVLAGAASLNAVGRFYSAENRSMNVGQTFVAIDPRLIFGEGFYGEIDEYVRKIRSARSMSENDVIHLPGDDRHAAARRAEAGIELDSATASLLQSFIEQKESRL